MVQVEVELQAVSLAQQLCLLGDMDVLLLLKSCDIRFFFYHRRLLVSLFFLFKGAVRGPERCLVLLEFKVTVFEKLYFPNTSCICGSAL